MSKIATFATVSKHAKIDSIVFEADVMFEIEAKEVAKTMATKNQNQRTNLVIDQQVSV